MNRSDKTVVIIPILEPGDDFITRLQEIVDIGLKNIIVVDDGNTAEYMPVFDRAEKLGCTIVHLGVNCGKGRALKTAFNHVLVNTPDIDVVVTADGDGTYLPEDILKVSENAKPGTITLGCRDFNDQRIPAANRRANAFTSFVLKILGGIILSDTQTGLRSYTRDLLPYLITAPGERYEYDFNVIVDKRKIELNEVRVSATVRQSDKLTHFKPLVDSWILIRSFLTFILTSLSTTIIDLMIYSFLISILIDYLPLSYIAVSTFIARIISDSFNYFMDKNVVFKSHNAAHIDRYIILALAKTVLSAAMVTALVFLFRDGETWIKMFVDTIIFFLGYRFEKNWVYE